MIVVCRPYTEHPGSYAFPPPGKTGKEVWLNQPGTDAKVRFDYLPIYL